MKVYHGSTACVMQPLAMVGRDNLDFGKGFYVTDIREQAERWALRISIQRKLPAVLNEYELNIDVIRQKFRCLKFEAYDIHWLEFIVKSREGMKPWLDYDLVEGGVADDRVIDTVEAYMNGMMTTDMALGRLIMYQPNNQICLLNQDLIDCHLHFISSHTL